MSKVSNTLTMLRLLESGKKYSVKELAEKLEVSPRMIKSYKEELEKCGIYIDTILGRYGGYVYHRKHNYNISFDYLDVDAIESVIYKLDLKERQKLNITLEKNHYLHRWLILLYQINLYILKKHFYLMLI